MGRWRGHRLQHSLPYFAPCLSWSATPTSSSIIPPQSRNAPPAHHRSADGRSRVSGGERSVSSPSQPGLITQIDCPPAASRDHIALAQSVHPSLSEMVVGATLSNILGAFSLGLIFQRQSSTNISLFDQSSTNYTVALLIVTCLASGRLTFGHPINWRAVGAVLSGSLSSTSPPSPSPTSSRKGLRLHQRNCPTASQALMVLWMMVSIHSKTITRSETRQMRWNGLPSTSTTHKQAREDRDMPVAVPKARTSEVHGGVLPAGLTAVLDEGRPVIDVHP